MRATPAALITFALTVFVLFTLAGYQVTGATAGPRLLGRIGASLVELDRWFPVHKDDIRLLARDRPNAPLALPNLPFDVQIPSSVAIEGSDSQLRTSVQAAIGLNLYHGGAGAIRGESSLSIKEPVRWTIELLGRGANSFWRFALILTGLLLLAFCAGMLWTRQSPLTSIAAGAGLAAVLALGVWLLTFLGRVLVGGAIDKEMVLVLRDGAWIGLRNALALAVIVLSLQYVLSTLGGRRRDEDPWPERPSPPEHGLHRETPPY